MIERPCAIPGCDRLAAPDRRICRGHAGRITRTGSPGSGRIPPVGRPDRGNPILCRCPRPFPMPGILSVACRRCGGGLPDQDDTPEYLVIQLDGEAET